MESKEEIVLDPIPLHFNPKGMLLTCKNAAAFLLLYIYMTTKMCFRCTVTLTYVGVARPSLGRLLSFDTVFFQNLGPNLCSGSASWFTLYTSTCKLFSSDLLPSSPKFCKDK